MPNVGKASNEGFGRNKHHWRERWWTVLVESGQEYVESSVTLIEKLSCQGDKIIANENSVALDAFRRKGLLVHFRYKRKYRCLDNSKNRYIAV